MPHLEPQAGPGASGVGRPEVLGVASRSSLPSTSAPSDGHPAVAPGAGPPEVGGPLWLWARLPGAGETCVPAWGARPASSRPHASASEGRAALLGVDD